jgi:hypothetical protein
MERVAGTQAILAMAYHQLGQAEQARSALRKSPFTANDNSAVGVMTGFLPAILEAEVAGIVEPQPVTKK